MHTYTNKAVHLCPRGRSVAVIAYLLLGQALLWDCVLVPGVVDRVAANALVMAPAP